jgi:hypothetical protein
MFSLNLAPPLTTYCPMCTLANSSTSTFPPGVPTKTQATTVPALPKDAFPFCVPRYPSEHRRRWSPLLPELSSQMPTVCVV